MRVYAQDSISAADRLAAAKAEITREAHARELEIAKLQAEEQMRNAIRKTQQEDLYPSKPLKKMEPMNPYVLDHSAVHFPVVGTYIEMHQMRKIAKPEVAAPMGEKMKAAQAKVQAALQRPNKEGLAEAQAEVVAIKDEENKAEDARVAKLLKDDAKAQFSNLRAKQSEEDFGRESGCQAGKHPKAPAQTQNSDGKAEDFTDFYRVKR